jgi:hypothetical protein
MNPEALSASQWARPTWTSATPSSGSFDDRALAQGLEEVRALAVSRFCQSAIPLR